MDNSNYTTYFEKRKRGKHLNLADRGMIQILKRMGQSNRAIARELNCSPSTVANELKRGTPKRRFRRGRIPGYSARYGQLVYEEHRKRCHGRYRILNCKDFVQWVTARVKEDHWSLDECNGYARINKLFNPDEMVCTKTLYNSLRKKHLPLSMFDLPIILRRKTHSVRHAVNRRIFGRSIDERPEISPDEFGHWEGDTVIGRKRKDDAVVFTLVEKLTRNFISVKIPSRTTNAVRYAMNHLRKEYGSMFSKVFKSITVDNGNEFDDFASFENYGTKIYFAHPYSSWERAQNERSNGLLRYFIPKGHSVNEYTSDEILQFADVMNAKPRRVLGYISSEQLFDSFLDMIYSEQ